MNTSSSIRFTARSLAAATVIIAMIIANASANSALAAFWRAVYPDYTDVTGLTISDFVYGYGYGSLGWWYGYGYGYGFGSYNIDGIGYYGQSDSFSTDSTTTAFENPTSITVDELSSVVEVDSRISQTEITQVTVQRAVQIASQIGSSSARVILPAGVQISTTDGSPFSTDDLDTEDTSDDTTVSGFGTISGATRFGSGSISFLFSKPIRVDIPVPGVSDGSIDIRTDHGSGFVTTGLTNSATATCSSNGTPSPESAVATVSSEVATIYTCLASTFAAVDDPTTSSSSSSSGGGGGGGSGGSRLTLDDCPDGDHTSSAYDGKCGTAPDIEKAIQESENLSTKLTRVDQSIIAPVTLAWTIEFETELADGLRRVVATSGRGSIVLKTNPNSSLFLTIPGDTVITSDEQWDGKFRAPVQLVNQATRENNVVILFAGSDTSNLEFSRPIQITVPVAYADETRLLVYSSRDRRNFEFHDRIVVEENIVEFDTAHLSYFVLVPETGGEHEDSTSDEQTDSVASFTDIADTFAREYIMRLAEMGVVSGYADGTFRPENTATRAEFLKMVMRGLDIDYDESARTTVFTDVVEPWQIPLVAAALERGFLSGQTIDGALVFRPNDPITRAEAMKILLNAAGIASEVRTTAFTDIVDSWQIGYVETARQLGIVSGQTVDGRLVFRPNDPITRAEVSKIVVETMNTLEADESFAVAR